MKIKLSTAKHILRMYRIEGRIFEKNATKPEN
jgi:hypothetical protein